MASEEFKKRIREAVESAAERDREDQEARKLEETRSRERCRAAEEKAVEIMTEVVIPVLADTTAALGVPGSPQKSHVVGHPCVSTPTVIAKQGRSKCIMVAIFAQGEVVHLRSGVAAGTPAGSTLSFDRDTKDRSYPNDVSREKVLVDLEFDLGGPVLTHYLDF